MTKDIHEEWRQLGQEHAHLHTLFGALECTVDRAAALEAVGDLQKWLERHFEREERPEGVLAAIVGEDEEVEAIRREHKAIETILMETRDRLEATDDKEASFVRDVMAILGASLRAHEKRETELIERFLGQASPEAQADES